MDGILDLLRLLAGSAFLIYGSWTDWTDRIVKDRVWKLMGATGLLLLEIQLLSGSYPAYFHLVILTILSLGIYPFVEPGKKTDLKEGFLAGPIYWGIMGVGAAAAAAFLYFGANGDDRMDAAMFFTIPVLMAMAYGLYRLRLLFGGADSKAVAFISLMMPFYPSFMSFPYFRPHEELEELVLPFPIIILVNALVLFLAAPLVFALYNFRKGEFISPYGFFGYRMDTKEVPHKFVWLMEKIRPSSGAAAAPAEGSENGNGSGNGSAQGKDDDAGEENGTVPEDEKGSGVEIDGTEVKQSDETDVEESDEREMKRSDESDVKESAESEIKESAGSEVKQSAGSEIKSINDAERKDLNEQPGNKLVIELFPKQSEDTGPYRQFFERHFEFTARKLDLIYDAFEKDTPELIVERSAEGPEGEKISNEELALLREFVACNDRSILREMIEKEDVRLLKKAVQAVMLKRLEAAGKDRVWVSPKIPFIIPIAVSFIVTFFVGSVLFSLLFFP